MQVDSGNATSTDDQVWSSYAALQNSLITQCIVAIAVICICTRIWSWHTFRSIKYGKGYNVLPPTLPYWIPGLKHALSMAYDSHGFLAKCMQVPNSDWPELSHRRRTDINPGTNTAMDHLSSLTAQAKGFS
jgi:hypothetical protein